MEADTAAILAQPANALLLQTVAGGVVDDEEDLPTAVSSERSAAGIAKRCWLLLSEASTYPTYGKAGKFDSTFFCTQHFKRMA